MSNARTSSLRRSTNPYLVSIHDTESLLELLDGTLGEHSEDIAAALLGFPGGKKQLVLSGSIQGRAGMGRQGC
jgi:hypothetical protein